MQHPLALGKSHCSIAYKWLGSGAVSTLQSWTLPVHPLPKAPSSHSPKYHMGHLPQMSFLRIQSGVLFSVPRLSELPGGFLSSFIIWALHNLNIDSEQSAASRQSYKWFLFLSHLSFARNLFFVLMKVHQGHCFLWKVDLLEAHFLQYHMVAFSSATSSPLSSWLYAWYSREDLEKLASRPGEPMNPSGSVFLFHRKRTSLRARILFLSNRYFNFRGITKMWFQCNKPESNSLAPGTSISLSFTLSLISISISLLYLSPPFLSSFPFSSLSFIFFLFLLDM